MITRALLLGTSLILVSCVSSCQREGDAKTTTVTSASLPKTTLVAEHARIANAIEQASDMVIELSNVRDDAELKERVGRIADFLEIHVAEHVRWEEAVVYDIIDERTRGGVNALTTPLRAEHRLIARWIVTLRDAAKEPYIDHRELVRRAHEVIGLVRAHVEIEDRLLVPILEQTMSWEELDRAMQMRAVPHAPPP